MGQKKKTGIPKENFAVGSHSPSSSGKVGAGYDDTGKGKYEKKNELDKEIDQDKKDQPVAGITHKQEPNAGSGSFNQGSEQDLEMNEGVADGTPHPEEISREKQNPKAKLRDNELKDPG